MKIHVSKGTKIILVVFVLIFHRFIFEFIMMGIYFILVLIYGNPMSYGAKKADDAISHSVYQEANVGISYLGREVSSKNVISYSYMLQTEHIELVENVVDIVNKTIEQENIVDKIEVFFGVLADSPDGVSVFCLYNYSDDQQAVADYKTLKRCDAWGCRSPSAYNEPSTYRDLPGIIDLRISEYVAQNAVEQGIDWHEYFPELERLEVILPEE